MKVLARVLAFASGLILYGAVVHIVGYLAAEPVPLAYFAWFGSDKMAALVIEEAFLIALPLFLFALLWSYLTLRSLFPLRLGARRLGAWCCGGLVLAWFVDLIFGVAYIANNQVTADSSVGAIFYMLFVPQPWSILNSVAAPAGVLVATLIASRSSPPATMLASVA